MTTTGKYRSAAVQRLYSELTARIRSGALPPAAYLPSAHTLAREYGVGYVSVIRVFKALSEAGLIETVQGRGAFVRGVQRPGLQELVVVLPSQTMLTEAANPHSGWVYHDLLAGMNKATLARAMHLQVVYADAVGAQWPAVADGLRAGTGVLFIMDAPPPWVARLWRRKIPCGIVMPFAYASWEAELPCAFADYRAGVCAAVTTLLRRGRRHALFLGIRDSHEGPRYQGFRDALAAAGGTEVALVPCDGISREDGRAAMDAYLADAASPFDLLVAGNDLRALGAMDSLGVHGIAVPAQVAVLGFDDIAAATEAGLSTVRLPVRELGEQSVGWFLDSGHAPTADAPLLRLPCPAIWRHSTGDSE